uniref:Dynein axonemal assembly factor 11-like CS domain-containing protein n=1 Tax=Palpitomonas bilix TaxID=652834 RepID=A0A7S3D110_9EUKA
MGRITETLIRQKAEHNEGLLNDLKEVSLHQLEIEKIEVLGKVCRELEILYLQNNLIGKLENLHRLKCLKYLNMAVNNITKVENLERCESLEKLDFTVNYIDVDELSSLRNLEELEHFSELYMTGNPCTDFEHYRQYVIGILPRLKRLDGEEVTPTERIQARQNLKEVEEKLEKVAAECRARKEKERAEKGEKVEEIDMEGKERRDHISVPAETFADPKYGPEERTRLHKEMAAQREEGRASRDKTRAELLTDEAAARIREVEEEKARREEERGGIFGAVRQKNEGGWKFAISEDKRNVIVEIGFPKFMSTSLIDLDVQPSYLKAVAKGKTIQLCFPTEVHTAKAEAKRSQTTGALVVTAPKLDPSAPVLFASTSATNEEEEKKRKEKEEKERRSRLKPLRSGGEGGKDDFRKIVKKKGEEEEEEEPFIKEAKPKVEKEVRKVEVPDDIDLSEVPDLE